MEPVKVKICGITRPEDAVLAAELGVDFIGLNFVGGPRKLDLARAGEILRVLPASVVVVALVRVVPLVPPTEGYVAGDFLLGDFLGTQLLPRRIRTFQIYGATGGIIHTQGEHSCEAFEWWEVVGINCQQEVMDLSSKLAEQKAGRPARVVLDVKVGGQLGGTGQSFDWNWLAEARTQGRDVGLPSVMLAGGLKPENVAEAVRLAQPWGVDVSSGVEVAGKPGLKDGVKMRDFIRAARGQ